uniref:PHD finger protein 14 n=1 Tax=Cacopsylla melanoneura TaxID=428564 RepID=A0A8D8SDC7_9HEMI
MERDPNKRRIKPPTQNYLDFEDLGESSDDSDFRIEDHAVDSDDDTINSDDSNGPNDEEDSGSDSDDSIGEKGTNGPKPVASNNVPVNILSAAQLKEQLDDISKFSKILVCCVCLGERSDDVNEIVECDSCGVTVHEGCYGVQDTASNSSTVSSCSTEPWFCESCRAGIAEPTCELCPNFGGIFKETDVGKWVHLVCALYIPGVAFGEVDRLSNVTLFEMPYSRWGAKSCALCPDESFARTGVCIQCDAGMCRTYFHVTCAQREGLLSEATSEEVDQADPFYAHCKLHSDKVLIKKRKRNFLSMTTRSALMRRQRELEARANEKTYVRIQRKLGKYKVKYVDMKSLRNPPWVPTQKLARPITSSATLCRALYKKAGLMEVDTGAVAAAQSDLDTLADMNKKWHIPLAFNVEFVAYFLNRNSRLGKLSREQNTLAAENEKLQSEASRVQSNYDELVKASEKRAEDISDMRTELELYHKVLLQAVPTKKLPSVDSIGKYNLHVTTNHHPLAVPGGGVPTAAALKAGVGFPLRNFNRTCANSMSTPTTTVTMATTPTKGTGSSSSGVLNHKCGLCHQGQDPHTLAKCDTCHLYYHLGCLSPPLLRMPKKTKLMGWQCSECDKESSDSNPEYIDTEAPRKLRHGRENSFQDDPLAVLSEELTSGAPSGKKRKRGPEFYHDKRDRYSPELIGKPSQPGSSRKKKKKKTKHLQNSSDKETGDGGVDLPPTTHPTRDGGEDAAPPQRQGIKLLIKSIPNPHSGVASTPQCFITTSQASVSIPSNVPPPPPRVSIPRPVVVRKEDPPSTCATCTELGLPAAMVKCDECLKSFHFGCLDPPVKKSPKVRGYSWHCADCDPTESDSS